MTLLKVSFSDDTFENDTFESVWEDAHSLFKQMQKKKNEENGNCELFILSCTDFSFRLV